MTKNIQFIVDIKVVMMMMLMMKKIIKMVVAKAEDIDNDNNVDDHVIISINVGNHN